MKIKRVLNDILLSTLTLISPTLNTKYFYYRRIGEKINLDNPVKFNEKIQWLKLNVYPKERIYSVCADKYKVREYVEKIGCKEILIDLIGVYDNPEEIDWNKLPKKFVLKWNFGSALNIVCADKSKLDEKETKKLLRKWKRKNFHLRTSEMHYKYINKKLICEKYLGDDIKDYKFYCYDGKVSCVMVCDERKDSHAKTYYFDKNWKFLRDYSIDGKNADKNFKIDKPKSLDKMFDYASKLSKGFPFVRVDLYNINGKIYFGELTFTPHAGLDKNKNLLPQEMADAIIIRK